MEFKSEMVISVWEKQCWICGIKKGHMTSHHTLPKHLKPKKNFICPVCEKCHEKLNSNDVRGIVSFAYKIQQTLSEFTVMVENMITRMKGYKKE